MFGQYKRITNRWELHRQGHRIWRDHLPRGDRLWRGLLHAEHAAQADDDVEGKAAVISGSGNVATHAAEKICELGGKVLTLSTAAVSSTIPTVSTDKIDWVKEAQERASRPDQRVCRPFHQCQYHEGKRPWRVECDLATLYGTSDEEEARAGGQ